MSLIKRLNKMDVKGFAIPLGKCTSIDLYYIYFQKG